MIYFSQDNKNSSSLITPSGQNDANINQQNQNTQVNANPGAPSWLPTPPLSKKQAILVDIYMITIMMLAFLRTTRMADREYMMQHLTMLVDIMNRQAQDMKDAALKQMIGAIVENATKIIGGIVQCRYSFQAGTTNSGDIAVSQAGNSFGQGLNQAISAAGGIVNAVLQFEAQGHAADQKIREAAQKMAENGMAQAQDYVRDMTDMLAQLLQSLKQLAQEDHDTTKDLIHSM